VGEELIGALVREVREETGVEIKVRQLAAVDSNTWPCLYALNNRAIRECFAKNTVLNSNSVREANSF